MLPIEPGIDRSPIPSANAVNGIRPQNTAGQSNSCTSGPAASVDITIPDARLADVNPIDKPRLCSGNTDAAIAGAVLYRQPVPSACNTRKPTSDSSVGDSDIHTIDTR